MPVWWEWLGLHRRNWTIEEYDRPGHVERGSGCRYVGRTQTETDEGEAWEPRPRAPRSRIATSWRLTSSWRCMGRVSTKSHGSRRQYNDTPDDQGGPAEGPQFPDAAVSTRCARPQRRQQEGHVTRDQGIFQPTTLARGPRLPGSTLPVRSLRDQLPAWPREAAKLVISQK